MKKSLLLLLFAVLCSSNAFALITQTNWRWRYDDGDQESATWTADTNVGIEMANGSTDSLRLRVEIVHKDAGSDELDAILWLQYSTQPDPDAKGEGVWTGISDDASQAFVFTSSKYLEDDQATTNTQLSSAYPDYEYVPGRVLMHQTTEEDSDKAFLVFEQRSEYVYTIRPTEHAAANTTYYFKVRTGDVQDGAPLPTITFVDKPQVSITSPVTRTTFFVGEEIEISAGASAADGIKAVEFYQGETLLETVTASPYTYTWTGAEAGNYTFTAKAIDNNDAVNTSAPVNVTVEAVKPTVSITSPSDGASFTAPEAIVITAEATAADGIKAVEFYRGETLLGTVTESPYTYTWSETTEGTYTLTAKAISDNDITNSASISVTVEGASLVPPTVSITSPANGTTFGIFENIVIKAEASAEDGISEVEFYSGEALLGSDLESPFDFIWTNAEVGTHIITAKAIGNNTATNTSAPVEIHVDVATGIFDGISSNDVNPYPNPFKDHVFIPVNLEKPGEVTIQVLDLKGQIIYSTEFYSPSGSHYFEWKQSLISAMPAGIYLYKVISIEEAKTGQILKSED